MTFTLHVEHEIVGGKVEMETFEGVESFDDPPMTSDLHISFADDRDDLQLTYGNVVRASDKSNNDR